MKFSAAILAAILDLKHFCDDYHEMLFMIGFLDCKNIYFDTRITFLSVILREIWPYEILGGHIGSHLGFEALL